MVVGFTGHQDIPEEALPLMGQTLSAFSSIVETSPRVCRLSQLALTNFSGRQCSS